MTFWNQAQSVKCFFQLLIPRLTPLSLLERESGFETVTQLADTGNQPYSHLWSMLPSSVSRTFPSNSTKRITRVGITKPISKRKNTKVMFRRLSFIALDRTVLRGTAEGVLLSARKRYLGYLENWKWYKVWWEHASAGAVGRQAIGTAFPTVGQAKSGSKLLKSTLFTLSFGHSRSHIQLPIIYVVNYRKVAVKFIAQDRCKKVKDLSELVLWKFTVHLNQ
jgi:hypothetical protein